MNEVERYINQKEPGIAAILSAVRVIILRSSPAVTEAIKYGIPFFSYGKLLCYLNPARNGVRLGFTRGSELSDGHGLLSGDGKQVRHLFIPQGGPIPEEVIRETLYEAMLIIETDTRLSGTR